MAISFNEIGTDIRAPLCFVEFDSSKAQQVSSVMQYRILAMGQKLSSGKTPALKLERYTSEDQGNIAFGKGSQLARMLAALFRNNSTTEVIAIALEDSAAGQKAKGTLTIGGATSTGGTLCLYVAGERVRIAVTSAMTADDTASALTAAINANETLPVTASNNLAVITLTAKNAGECGNDIDVRLNYYDGEDMPEGLQVTFEGAELDLDPGMVDGRPNQPCEVAAMLAGVSAYYAAIDPARPLQTLPLKGCMPPKISRGMRLKGGTGNPDVQDVFAAMDDRHYHVFVLPYTDGANLMAVKEEMARRWGPLKMIGGVAMAGYYGGHSKTGAFGDNHNSPHLLLWGTGGPWTREERNLLLWDGIATGYEDADGLTRIERMVTTYKENALGAPDRAYLDVETIFTLEYLRYDLRAYFMRKYPRHKLAKDGTRYGQGQAIITPKTAKAECVAWFAQMETMGLVEGMAQFKNDLIAEINAQDECRLDIYLPPDLVNQLRILAIQVGFRL